MLEQTTGRTKLLTRSKTAGSIKVHSSDFTNELVQTDPIHKVNEMGFYIFLTIQGLDELDTLLEKSKICKKEVLE